MFLVLGVSAQRNLTTEQWQEDLRFLQNTVHKDYSFLFKKITSEDFDAEVETLYNEIPNLQEHEIIVGFSRIVSSFKYGHTSFGFWYGSNFRQLPLNMYQFSDGVYIQGTHKNYEQILGAKVLRVGNYDIEEALEKIYPTVPSENDQFFKADGVRYLTYIEFLHAQGITDTLSNSVTYTLEKEGKVFKQTITNVNQAIPLTYRLVRQDNDWLDVRNQEETPYYLKHLDKIYYYEYLPEDKTVYVRHSQIQDDPNQPIPSFYQEVFDFIDENDVEKLVLDYRLNGGGNNYKNKPIVTGIIQSEKINQPGKLFVVIGRQTFSACQNLVNELSNYTNAIFIGEPTGENVNFYGDNRQVTLPNSKMPVYLSFAWWQDKPQWESADWLAPHIAVDMSFDDYKTNKDPVLDRVLSFSDENYILNPMNYMYELFSSGQVERLKAETTRMANDSNYDSFDFEGELRYVGNSLLNRDQKDDALLIFQFITELYPESSDAWNDLGDNYFKMSNKKEALKAYKKVLKLNLDSEAIQYAKEMIRKTKELS